MKSSNLSTTTCSICSKTFTGRNSKTQLAAHKKWCSKKQTFLELYSLDYTTITTEYERLGSVLNFMKKYPFWPNFTSYYKLFKELGIDYSLKKSLEKEVTKQKRKDTSIERYGFHSNFVRDAPSRLKWEKRLLEEEGITNVFQREDVKAKSAETFVEKYKTERWMHSLVTRGGSVISSLNKLLFNLLDELGIKYEIELKLKREKSYFAYDVVLENKKIIEVNGDYWHGNPTIYKATDLILKGSSKEMLVSDKWARDLEKENLAIKEGYRIITIWEKEIKENLEQVKQKIIDYANS